MIAGPMTETELRIKLTEILKKHLKAGVVGTCVDRIVENAQKGRYEETIRKVQESFDWGMPA